MTTRAVVFDLDDTLIVEVPFAMASLREALSILPGVEPDADEVTALEAVRSVWTAGVDYPLCASLGFASWEGLWSTFEDNHPSLGGLVSWAPTYRIEAWRAVGAAFGIDDPHLLDEAAATFETAQRRGHPVIAGMRGVLSPLRERSGLRAIELGSEAGGVAGPDVHRQLYVRQVDR